MKMWKVLIILPAIVLCLVLVGSYGDAAITGPCSNCHTMHNSQNNSPMATYGADGQPWKGTGPYSTLTRGNCLGCHGIGTSKIVTIGGSEMPQVYHTDASGDLAGGNFAYITGAKGSGASNAKGHNIIELNIPDPTYTYPPGHRHIDQDPNAIAAFTCAGANGCHGRRVNLGSVSGIPSLKGAHHKNVDGRCDVATFVYNSYRFLDGIKGFENNGTYKWQNKDASNHNEYFGATAPLSSGCSNKCHEGGGAGSTPIRPQTKTISAFCATCHGDFHRTPDVYAEYNPSKGWGRHPTDVILPGGSSEYAGYVSYNVDAPVGRTTVSSSISATVTPGTDVVICLSCHAAHASDYPYMLRWDYSIIVAGTTGAGQGKGCFICHTQKDG